MYASDSAHEKLSSTPETKLNFVFVVFDYRIIRAVDQNSKVIP